VLRGAAAIQMGLICVPLKAEVRFRAIAAERRLLQAALMLTGPHTLTGLERAIAEAICNEFPEGRDALLLQLATAKVTGRNFTGVGFYTEFEVDHTIRAPQPETSPFGEIRSYVGPDRYELLFMLYVRNGYLDMIEAYSFYDGYGPLDLLTCEYTPPEHVQFNRGVGRE
jgi:hypothetical protein